MPFFNSYYKLLFLTIMKITQYSIANIMSNATTLLPHSASPHLDLEVLLGQILGKDKTWMISHSDFILVNTQVELLVQLITKRNSGVSIAQIIGTKEFWKYNFIVSENTLVPRPDSEVLIDAILQLYPNTKQKLSMADFGAGTGCLIISALLEYKNAIGIAFEKSKLAYNIACKNSIKHQLSSRLRIMLSSWEKCYNKFDIMVSNPPYIKRDNIPNLPNTIAQYEPQIALDGGFNGLKCYQSIIKVAQRCLKPQGKLLFEIGQAQQIWQIKNIIKNTPLCFHKTYYDLSQQVRALAIIHKP